MHATELNNPTMVVSLFGEGPVVPSDTRTLIIQLDPDLVNHALAVVDNSRPREIARLLANGILALSALPDGMPAKLDYWRGCRKVTQGDCVEVRFEDHRFLCFYNPTPGKVTVEPWVIAKLDGEDGLGIELYNACAWARSAADRKQILTDFQELNG